MGAAERMAAALAAVKAPVPWMLCSVSGCILDATGAPVAMVYSEGARDDDTLGPLASWIVFAVNTASGLSAVRPPATAEGAKR